MANISVMMSESSMLGLHTTDLCASYKCFVSYSRRKYGVIGQMRHYVISSLIYEQSPFWV